MKRAHKPATRRSEVRRLGDRCRKRWRIRQASSTVFSQLLPFVALARFWGVCFRSQRLRLARLMGEFSDGFLTVLDAMDMLNVRCSNGFRVAIARLVVRVKRPLAD